MFLLLQSYHFLALKVGHIACFYRDCIHGPGVQLVHFDVTSIHLPFSKMLAQPHLIPPYEFPSLIYLLNAIFYIVIWFEVPFFLQLV